MAKYRPFMCSFWTDPDIEKLSSDEKLVYAFFFTNQLTSESGIYSISKKYISERTNIKTDKISKILNSLQNIHKKITYDDSIVFVHGFMKRNFKGNPALLEISIIQDFNNFKSFACWNKFIDTYKFHHISIKIKELLNTLQSVSDTSMTMKIEIDNDISNVLEVKKVTWQQNTDEGFEEYLKISEPCFDALLKDWKWIEVRKEYFPGCCVKRTLFRMWEEFWGTKAGWKNKRDAARCKPDYEMDWKSTIERNFKKSICYYGKDEQDDEKTQIEMKKKFGEL